MAQPIGMDGEARRRRLKRDAYELEQMAGDVIGVRMTARRHGWAEIQTRAEALREAIAHRRARLPLGGLRYREPGGVA